jgi:hypothetical protein
VKVNGVCYRVEPPAQFNPNNTHEVITLDKGANGQVLYFTECADCGESGAFCEDSIDIEPNFGTGNTLIGRYVTEEYFGAGYECIRQNFYWDCESGEFLEQEETGYGQCQQPLGWNNLPSSGTTLIPAPVLREGYLLEECCLDTNTGFYYDVYIELDTIAGGRAGTMTQHKLCCGTQPEPTTTTSTTPPPEYTWLVRDCNNVLLDKVVSTTLNLTGGQVVEITNYPTDCWTVLDYTTGTPEETVVDVFTNCSECDQALNGGGGGSSSN